MKFSLRKAVAPAAAIGVFAAVVGGERGRLSNRLDATSSRRRGHGAERRRVGRARPALRRATGTVTASNGCNPEHTETLVVSIASRTPASHCVAEAVTFGGCGDTSTLTITPVAGLATISVPQTCNNTGRHLRLGPASFTVNVAPPPNTAPTVSVEGVDGARLQQGSCSGCHMPGDGCGGRQFLLRRHPVPNHRTVRIGRHR